MGMFNFVLDSFKGEIFDFKVDRRVLVASTVLTLIPTKRDGKVNFLYSKLVGRQEMTINDCLT